MKSVENTINKLSNLQKIDKLNYNKLQLLEKLSKTLNKIMREHKKSIKKSLVSI